MQKYAAIVVTYNRAEKLVEALDSILSQTQLVGDIIVIDNASDDSTPQLLEEYSLKEPRLRGYRTRLNIGGAGGFALGLKLAYDRGATRFWLMDDDAWAQHDALEILSNTLDNLSEDEDVGFVCSKVLWRDGTPCLMNLPLPTWDWLWSYQRTLPVVRVQQSSFVSLLLQRHVVEEVGLPIREFFIWFDDAEYTQRLSSRWPCYCVLDSIVEHRTPTNYRVDYSAITADELWKYRLGARNEAWHLFRQTGGIVKWSIFLVVRWREMTQGQVPWKIKRAVLASIFKAPFFRVKRDSLQTIPAEDLLVRR